MSRVDIGDVDESRYLLKVGDLLFARRSLTLEGAGQCSIVAAMDEPTTWESSILRARVDASVADPNFLYYYFRSPAGLFAMSSIATQVAAAGIKSSDLAKLEIPAVSLEVQRRISEVLIALDDKIAANVQLVAMVDDLILAQSSLIRSGSLEQVTLGDIVQLNYGRALPVAHRRKGEVAVVGSSGIIGAHDEPIVQGPNVVVGRKGAVGETYWLDGPAYPIDTTYWVESREVPLVYAYTLLKSINFSGMSTDSAVPGLNRDRAYAIAVTLPSSKDLFEFERVTAPLLKRAAVARDENQRLAATRDELLPLLMSGKITVKDAEKTVEEVV